MGNPISRSLPDVSIDSVFTEVQHNERLGLRDPEQLRLFHLGYLPAAVRKRIEDMFRKGKITTMFCTSTLLEGVNLPADNLFITDNKIFRARMTPVDFRNLIGRVGRIEYNLYGNVIFVSSQDEKLPETEYVKMLKEPVPKQTLSIDAGPKTLTNSERKYIVEALKEGNIELVKRNKTQSEEAYIMMRKFGLILLATS